MGSNLLSCCDQSRRELVADDSSLSAKAGSRLRPSAEPASTTVLCKTLRRLAAQLASRWLARLRSNVLALLGPARSAFGPLVGTGMAMRATRQNENKHYTMCELASLECELCRRDRGSGNAASKGGNRKLAARHDTQIQVLKARGMPSIHTVRVPVGRERALGGGQRVRAPGALSRALRGFSRTRRPPPGVHAAPIKPQRPIVLVRTACLGLP